MEKARAWLGEKWPVLLALAAGAAVCAAFGEVVWMAVRIAGTAGLAALLLEGPVDRLSAKIPRGAAAAVCLLGLMGVLAGLGAAAAPVLWNQVRELFERMDQAQAGTGEMLEKVNGWLEARQLPALRWEGMDWGALARKAGAWLGETAAAAGGLVRRISETGVSVLLAYYMLRDMEALKLRLEWLLPRKGRGLGLKMAAEIRSQLGGYLRGQAMICLAVGALAGAGLWLAGTPGAAVMGAVVGIFNMIPYFGPVIGGAPAVLLALGKGGWCALKTLAVLFAVQQIDGYWISPRFMGQSTGLHPALVLLGITLGGAASGTIGMLLAVPFMLIIRSVVRIWCFRHEMV